MFIDERGLRMLGGRPGRGGEKRPIKARGASAGSPGRRHAEGSGATRLAAWQGGAGD
jgi:hypothetical protein